MYTRELQENRYDPVENGAPLQGTWTSAFREVDLLRIYRPYRIPLPMGIIDSRIKEWEAFLIQDDRFLLQAQLCNLKYYRTASVLLYNKVTKERREFRKAIPGGAWRLPRFLYNSSVDSHSLGFFFRIHSWLDTGTVSLELNVEKKGQRPAFTAHANFDLAEGRTTPMAVSLLFSERRNMYAYKALAAVKGDVVLGGSEEPAGRQHIHFDPAGTSGFFCDFKGYYPYRMRCTWCMAMWFDDQKRRLGFTLGENQAREPYKNNENALWIDGQLTLLPPVKITHNGGPESNWIIQDMEGMVDLVFTPKEPWRSALNFVLTASDYENPLGVFNGLMVSAEGDKLPVHNVWGMVEKLYLRV